MDASAWTILATAGSLATAVVTAIYTFYTARMVKGELGPKVYIEVEAKDSTVEYDNSINQDIGLPEYYKKVGFVSELADRKIVFKVNNNGITPATNIKLKYTIHLYKHQVKIEEHTGIIDQHNTKLIIEKKFKRTVTIDYLPPNGQIEKTVMFMDYFPYIEIQVNSLKSDKRKYIRKDTLIFSYWHPGFDSITDSQDMRLLLGSKWQDEDDD